MTRARASFLVYGAGFGKSAAALPDVIPAEAKRRAGIQNSAVFLDPRLRGDDGAT
jgi:hypothetical protein